MKKLSSGSFVIRYIAWWITWIVLQTWVLHHAAGIPFRLAICDALLTNLVLGLAGFKMIRIIRHFQPRQVLRAMWSIMLAIVCVAVLKWTFHQLFPQETAYLEFVNKWIIVRGLFAWLMISFITVLSWMWFYMQDLQEAQLRKADTEKMSREAELSMLRQQLQPHFLFNSLNSISALAGSRPEEARKMIQQLSDFLRGTIRRDDQQIVNLDEELNHLQLYLDIEKVRFGHRLKTVLEKDEACVGMRLPSLLLQPLVENAIKFGLYDTTGEITIRIEARADKNYLLLRIENPFDPATATPRQGTGFGLTSVHRRLYLLYGRHDLLTTKQRENIFHTEVRIPQAL